MFAQFFWNAWPIVEHCDFDRQANSAPWADGAEGQPADKTCAYNQSGFACFGHGIARIREQVGENLLKRILICMNRRD